MATTFGGRRPEDGKVIWQWSAAAIYNLIRAVTHPYPGAFTFHSDKKLYLLAATLNPSCAEERSETPGTIEAVKRGRGMVVSTGDGSLLVTRAQFEGEEELSADLLAERYKIPVGARLGQ